MKERGTGNIKFMRDKTSHKIRAIMRQEKTLKPVANFISNLLTQLKMLVQDSPFCDLIPMKNNDKAFVFSCNDFSEEEPKLETLAVRLQNAESKSNLILTFE